MTQEIFTTGFPRVGSNWLGRILSDLLNSPMQTMPDKKIDTEFAERIEEPYPYIIRRTHWYLDQWADMDHRGYGGEPAKIIWITRDPRDMVVSMMHYRRQENIIPVIKSINNGGKRKERGLPGGFIAYVDGWIRNPPDFRLSYEGLHVHPEWTLQRLHTKIIGKPVSPGEIERVVERQEFDKWQPKYPGSMYEGTHGQWRRHFDREAAELMDELYGDQIIDLGYERNSEWVTTVN